ncbi:MAG: hypothetical protein ACODAE_00435 [Gemmatimonadota bacterium]
MLLASALACTGAPDDSSRRGGAVGAADGATAADLPGLYAPGVLSTADYELNAAFSPGGDTLLFTKSAFSHWWMTVFMVTREGDGWSEPEVAPFSGRYSDADAIYSPDGSAVYLISDRPIEPGGSPAEFNIWRVPVTNGEFGEPEPLPAPIRSDGNDYFPAVASGGALYFSSARDGGVGGYDLYRSEPDGAGGWTEPVLLPETVNGESSEIDVVVDPDERFLVFAAYGRDDGLGSGDLYVSFRTDEGGWTEAENLGEPVNSSAREYAPGLSPDGEYLYVTSERTLYERGETRMDTQRWNRMMRGPGNGAGDIYRYRIADLPAFAGTPTARADADDAGARVEAS